MATTTPNMSLLKPAIDGDSGTWDTSLNASIDLLDLHSCGRDADCRVALVRLGGRRGQRRGRPAADKLPVAVARDELAQRAVRGVEDRQQVGARVAPNTRPEALDVGQEAESSLETRGR